MLSDLKQYKPKSYMEARDFVIKIFRMRFLKKGKTKLTEEHLVKKFIALKKIIQIQSQLSWKEVSKEFFFDEVLVDLADEEILKYDESTQNYHLTPYAMKKFEESAFWHRVLFRLPLVLMILNILLMLYFNIRNIRVQNAQMNQPAVNSPMIPPAARSGDSQ